MDSLKTCLKFSRCRFSRISSSPVNFGLVLFLAFLALHTLSGTAQSLWRTVGPDGGDARSFASVPGHPEHLYLGTALSTLYESVNGGTSWKRLARLDPA